MWELKNVLGTRKVCMQSKFMGTQNVGTQSIVVVKTLWVLRFVGILWVFK